MGKHKKRDGCRCSEPTETAEPTLRDRVMAAPYVPFPAVDDGEFDDEPPTQTFSNADYDRATDMLLGRSPEERAGDERQAAADAAEAERRERVRQRAQAEEEAIRAQMGRNIEPPFVPPNITMDKISQTPPPNPNPTLADRVYTLQARVAVEIADATGGTYTKAAAAKGMASVELMMNVLQLLEELAQKVDG